MPLLTTQSAKGYGLGLFTSSALTSYESISTTTISSTTSDITFSSIPSTYKHLQFRIIMRSAKTVHNWEGIRLRFNGATTNYAAHLVLFETGLTAGSYGYTSITSMPVGYLNTNGSTTSAFGAGIVEIPDYSSTTKNKMFLSQLGGVPNSTYGSAATGLYMSTSAISSVTFFTDSGSGFTANTSIALYGIKE